MGYSAEALRLRRRHRTRLVSDINVAPFVDVMLVLVVIFMIAAPLLTIGMQVDLPKATLDPLNSPREPLIVSIDNDGTVFFGETEIEPDILGPRLAAIALENSELQVFLRGDRDLDYGSVMRVMALIKRSGFSKVALVTEFPEPGDN